MNNRPTREQVQKATDEYNKATSLGLQFNPETLRILAAERLGIIEDMRKEREKNNES